MLGYIYQCEYALYHLLDRDKLTVQVSIETMDDVVSESGEGDPQELLQLKHHRKEEGRSVRSLTDRHEDLWKTLRIWATLINGEIESSETSFFLMTTSPKGGDEDSIAYFLAPKGGGLKRDPVKALNRLENLATEIFNEVDLSEKGALKKGASAFLLLPTEKRIHLVNNMTIVTSSPSIRDLRKKIDQRLRASGGTDEIHPQFVEGVVGWWYGACVHHLAGRGARSIPFEALERKIAELSQILTLSALPRYDIADALADDEVEALRGRTFVQQILAIGHRPEGELMLSAMLDFYKADAHRKRWIEEFRVDLTDLGRFEGDLRGAWGVHFGSAEIECEDCASSVEPEKAYQKLGQRVLRDTLSMPAPDLKGFSAPFLARGSYHILAGGDQPTIGWHPQWRARFGSGKRST
ncbi:MAG: ABC-three component system protein [Caulobacteraceae bacterium]